jgi:hypothetical protein
MRPTPDPTGHRVPRTKPTCLLHTWRPHRQRPFALVLHLHQHESSRNPHLQYLAKNQSTQHCQSLITQGSDHPPVLEPHMVLSWAKTSQGENKSGDTVELENKRDLAIATPQKGFPFYTSTETQRSSQPTEVGTSGAIRQWPHGAR